MSSVEPELRDTPHWRIQNPLTLCTTLKRWQASGRNEDDLKDLSDRLQLTYKQTIRTLNNWLKWLDERDVQPTEEIHELYKISVGIESNIEAILSSLTRLSERREQWQTTRTQFQNAETATTGLKNMAEIQRALELTKLEGQVARARQTIQLLVGQYNGLALSKSFAGNIRSAIRMLQYRKKELVTWYGTELDVDIVDESIKQLHMTLDVIEGQGEETVFARLKYAVTGAFGSP